MLLRLTRTLKDDDIIVKLNISGRLQERPTSHGVCKDTKCYADLIGSGGWEYGQEHLVQIMYGSIGSCED